MLDVHSGDLSEEGKVRRMSPLGGGEGRECRGGGAWKSWGGTCCESGCIGCLLLNVKGTFFGMSESGEASKGR
jgi:hypothetical protein